MMKFSVDLMSIGRHNLSFPTWVFSHQYSSVTQLCPTLCNPMDCSTGKPGFPVHHQFLELPQTHVHWVGDAIQPSHLLLFPSPPAFPGGSEVKASARNAGDVGSIPGLGISPGERNGNPLQYSCLENPMDGRAWQAIGHGTERFHFHALEKEMATHSSVLAWRIPEMGVWWAAIYGVAQSQTWLSDWTELLCWSFLRVPWMEKRSNQLILE